MSKNPVRGYILCPVCNSVSTVHQVGEGKLIATGEPPKNTRNTGKMYYKCPSCGNSPMSQSTHDFVVANKVDDQNTLATFEADEICETTALTVVDVVDEVMPQLTDITEAVTVIDEQAEVSTDAVLSADSALLTDENAPQKRVPFLTPKRVFIALGAVGFIAWVVHKLNTKAVEQTEAVAHGHT